MGLLNIVLPLIAPACDCNIYKKSLLKTVEINFIYDFLKYFQFESKSLLIISFFDYFGCTISPLVSQIIS